MVIYETFKDSIKKKNATLTMEYTNDKYRRTSPSISLVAHGVEPLEVQPLRYQFGLPPIEIRQFGELGREINRLESKIERLEKALASKSIPKNITTSALEDMTKTAVEKELNEFLYEPLTKGIAILAGVTAIFSITVSIIVIPPLAILSGLFWWTYFKLKQKRIHTSTYYSPSKKRISFKKLIKKKEPMSIE